MIAASPFGLPTCPLLPGFTAAISDFRGLPRPRFFISAVITQIVPNYNYSITQVYTKVKLFFLCCATSCNRKLSFEQEKQLVANKGLLLVAVCVVNGYRFEEILSQYQFSEPELIRQLVALDKLGVIELLPANRIKMKISPDFRWVPGGPIQCFFQQQVQNEFFHSYFSADDEKLVMSSGLMSLPSNHKLQHKIQKLVDEFYAGCKADEVLDLSDRHGTSMVIGLRRWTFPLFDDLLRTPKS